MTVRTRRTILLFLGAASAAVMLSFPSVHWRLYGWVRGEAFYRGKPVSYWSHQLTAFQFLGFMDEYEAWDLPVDHFGRLRYRIKIGLGVRERPRFGTQTPLSGGDPSYVGVLRHLLTDANPKVRALACMDLGELGDFGAILRPLLADDAEVEAWCGVDPPFPVRKVAAIAIARIDRRRPATRPAVELTIWP